MAGFRQAVARIQAAYEKVMSTNIPMWAFLLFVLFSLLTTVGFGWAVNGFLTGDSRFVPYGPAIKAITGFPYLVKQTITEAVHSVLPTGAQSAQRYGLTVFGGFKDDGYLLLSNVIDGAPTVQLMRLADGQTLYEWKLDPAEAKRVNPDGKLAPKDMPLFSPNHAVLLADGGVVGGSDGPLVKLDRCSRVAWVLPGNFHHALEPDADGTFWASSVMPKPAIDPRVYPEVRDDALAHVSADGRLLEITSVSRILLDNGYGGLLFGNGAYDQDPVHLNEVYPAKSTTSYWKKGDLLLSSRHRSTVFLYRPSEKRIVWAKTGPWLNQHDAEFYSDHLVTVFGNDNIRLRPEALNALPNPKDSSFPNGISAVYVYDLASGKITTPYQRAMAQMKVAAASQGRAELLPNGDAFIDNAVFGFAFRASPSGVRWTYNVGPAGAVMHWSRYLSAATVAPILPQLNCRHQLHTADARHD